jgi:hypothetical protein
MATVYGKCAACRSTIHNKEFLVCLSCNLKYDIQCINITPQRFHAFYGPDQDRRRSWKCPECCSKLPKVDNSNTPVKVSAYSSPDAEDNVTKRPKTKNPRGHHTSPALSTTLDSEQCQISKQEWTDILQLL